LSRDYFITIGKDAVNKLWDLERWQEIRDFKDDYEVTGAVYIPHVILFKEILLSSLTTWLVD
jgi:hypothetical protein